MSRTDDERLGLGWEVWFLLAILNVGATVALLIPAIIGIGFEAAAPHTAPRGHAMLEWPRVVVGVGAAVMFATVAVRIVRRTDWHMD